MSSTARLPKYCRHKAQNKGYVTLEGRVIYFPGAWGSAESKVGYDQLIAKWTLNGRRLSQEAAAPIPAPNASPSTPASPQAPMVAEGCTVLELLDAYLPYAEGYYVKDGKQTTQVTIIKAAFRILLALYESLPASEFGPKKLAIVRDAMIAKGWCQRSPGTCAEAFSWRTPSHGTIAVATSVLRSRIVWKEYKSAPVAKPRAGDTGGPGMNRRRPRRARNSSRVNACLR
jgi:hypothetical protein